MTHSHPARTAALLLPVLLLPGPVIAQTTAQPAVQAPAASTPAPLDATPAAPSASPGTAPGPTTNPMPMTAMPATPAPSGMPTAAEQAVLDRIRRLRNGNQRRFGSCSYRWDSWKLLPDGNRTTTYSCDGSAIVDRTIGVNCSKLQINSYDPVPQASARGTGKTEAKAESWTWGTWRLPQQGGEEQMVASLCANALPTPPAAAGPVPPSSSSPPAPQATPAGKR